MLHQGSILLDRVPEISRDQIRDALIMAFESELGEFKEFRSGDSIIKEAQSLAESRYSTPEWNQKS